ncbi:MAG: endolytic transglycosylase MltG [Desulfobacterales bacterium]|nr:endolytic transglycosylase MltG [Desulfobacterales bacterium]
MFRKILFALIMGVFIAVCAAAVLWVEVEHYALRPAAPADPSERTVLIRGGQPFSAVVELLVARGVVQSPLKFRVLARLRGVDRRIKAGEYALRASMTPLEILAALERGAVKLHRLIIPEGWTVQQIAAAVEAAGLGAAADTTRLAGDPALARRHGIEADSLEGYLFPDTYLFPRGVAAETIVGVMLERFREVFTPEWSRRAAELGFSVHAVVTLASIIEKETGAAAERALISSVFHNRLAKGMRLETDPTVIYGIENFDGNLTRRHLATPTPYNTYLIRGLPPGPIASPGSASLHAALYPAQTDYLFFVSRNDGTHVFSSSLEEHNRAVRQHQSRQPPGPRTPP